MTDNARLAGEIRDRSPIIGSAAWRKKRICTCGHLFTDHIETGTTGRANGPTTYKACSHCDCWAPRDGNGA